MHGVETQQMGVGLDRAEIVDADHLDILAAGFRDGPQDIAADAAKSVDRYPDCHARFSSNRRCRPRGAVPRGWLRRNDPIGRAGTARMGVTAVLWPSNVD